MNNVASGVIGGIAGAIITIVINWLVDIPVLRANVNDLRDNQKKVFDQLAHVDSEINDINQNYIRIAQFLSDKSHFNLTELVKLSNKKGISPIEFQKVTTMLENNSPGVENYLTKNLNFTSAEIQTVRSSGHQDKKQK